MIFSTWAEMLRRLAITFPQWVIARLDARSDGKGFAVKAIPLVIVFLSLASITNLAGRAYVHHGDYSAYLTGAGIAVLVPIAVLAAMLIDGKWSYLFWCMALIFAGISGTIQFNIYLLDSTWLSIAEAVAFGYGVPVSEVMLAVMEARLVTQVNEHKAKELLQAAIIAKAEKERMESAQRAEEERRAKLQREAEDREFERRKREAELIAYELKLAQDAEIERERAMADLRIKEQKAGAKIIKPEPFNRANDRANDRASSGSDKYTKQVKMIELYRANPSLPLAKLGETLDVSKSTARNYRDELVRLSVLDLHGEGKQQLVKVNGQSDVFLNGEL